MAAFGSVLIRFRAPIETPLHPDEPEWWRVRCRVEFGNPEKKFPEIVSETGSICVKTVPICVDLGRHNSVLCVLSLQLSLQLHVVC